MMANGVTCFWQVSRTSVVSGLITDRRAGLYRPGQGRRNKNTTPKVSPAYALLLQRA